MHYLLLSHLAPSSPSLDWEIYENHYSPRDVAGCFANHGGGGNHPHQPMTLSAV
jgi:hypothetical protein